MINYSQGDIMDKKIILDNNEVIFMDEDILVINKPTGILSIKDGYDPSIPHLQGLLEPQFGPLWIVHRLDKETSGIIILARQAIAHRILNESFRNRTIEKKYHALITPVPTWQSLKIEYPLKPDADRKHRTRVDHDQGKPANSKCQLLKRFSLGALIEIEIYTGITHQIRAHLRAHQFAIFGDKLYNSGLPVQPISFARTMLHARFLSLTHPITKERLMLTAPYPTDFRDAYTKLRFTKAQDEVL
jgi:RluA family pseudouridine synthase